MYNIRTGSYKGELYSLNPGEETIQDLPSYRKVSDLPETDLAFLAIPAKLCTEVIRELAATRNTRAFVIVSAGFSEESEEGAGIERKIVEICNQYGAALIGPNCIGVMTPGYQGVFTLPVPPLNERGCDFISGSGATAVFIMESGLQNGLPFNHMFSVGNSAQTGVEDVLQYLDETYREGISSRVKILYLETIRKPEKLLRHAVSLIRKGCRIAAVKAGTTEAGSRAASSHTGAMASPDMAVDALFRKAGIVRCFGRMDLTTVASAMLYQPMKGKNLALITHAGGPAVMMTDVLSGGGMDVPPLSGPKAEELLEHLHPGSSVSNPIDLLATGNAEQVGIAIDYCEKEFHEIDGMVVIFGTPGLAPVFDVYKVLHEKMESCSKPIYPVLPSVTTAREEVREFLSRGHVNFPDEVLLGEALTRMRNTPFPADEEPPAGGIKYPAIRRVIESAGSGYLEPGQIQQLLDAAGIPRVPEGVVTDEASLEKLARRIGFPLAMKVVGPLHKSDVGGVRLDIENEIDLMEHFREMNRIEGARGVLLQPMLEGVEVFAGASFEPGFGHMVMCGIGGIYVEVMKDIATGLAPLTMVEARRMIRSLRGYPMLEGIRGQEGLDVEAYASVLVRLSVVLDANPEIAEIDLNPIMGRKGQLMVADARIRTDLLNR